MNNSLMSLPVWGVLAFVLAAYAGYRFFHYREKRKVDQARKNLKKVMEDGEW